MAFIMPKEGVGQIFQAIQMQVGQWTPYLFTNNRTPGTLDTAANYTSAMGVQFMPGNMGQCYGAATTVGTTWQMTATNLVFTFTMMPGMMTETYYGWYVMNGMNGMVLAERFATPRTMSDMGQTVSISGHTLKVWAQ